MRVGLQKMKGRACNMTSDLHVCAGKVGVGREQAEDRGESRLRVVFISPFGAKRVSLGREHLSWDDRPGIGFPPASSAAVSLYFWTGTRAQTKLKLKRAAFESGFILWQLGDEWGGWGVVLLKLDWKTVALCREKPAELTWPSRDPLRGNPNVDL